MQNYQSALKISASNQPKILSEWPIQPNRIKKTVWNNDVFFWNLRLIKHQKNLVNQAMLTASPHKFHKNSCVFLENKTLYLTFYWLIGIA